MSRLSNTMLAALRAADAGDLEGDWRRDPPAYRDRRTGVGYLPSTVHGLEDRDYIRSANGGSVYEATAKGRAYLASVDGTPAAVGAQVGHLVECALADGSTGKPHLLSADAMAGDDHMALCGRLVRRTWQDRVYEPGTAASAGVHRRCQRLAAAGPSGGGFELAEQPGEDW